MLFSACVKSPVPLTQLVPAVRALPAAAHAQHLILSMLRSSLAELEAAALRNHLAVKLLHSIDNT